MGYDRKWLAIDKQLCLSDTEWLHFLIARLHELYVTIVCCNVLQKCSATLLAAHQFQFTKHSYVFTLLTLTALLEGSSLHCVIPFIIYIPLSKMIGDGLKC